MLWLSTASSCELLGLRYSFASCLTLPRSLNQPNPCCQALKIYKPYEPNETLYTKTRLFNHQSLETCISRGLPRLWQNPHTARVLLEAN